MHEIASIDISLQKKMTLNRIFAAIFSGKVQKSNSKRQMNCSAKLASLAILKKKNASRLTAYAI